ncbi:MAG: GNAT family N-acetyltransferase [Candidatus Eisenbacteria bacterium]
MARAPLVKIRKLEIHPASAERWDDLESLFGPRGACAGCWCMWWRLPSAEFSKSKGDGNRLALKRRVEAGGRVPGLLAYADGQPVGWVSLAPREEFPRLERSRTLARIDDRPVWSIVCFFVARPYRRQGLTVRLLEAGVRYARENGASAVEGYPVDPRATTADAWVYTGLASAFAAAGFREVARRSATRPIYRREIEATTARTTAKATERASARAKAASGTTEAPTNAPTNAKAKTKAKTKAKATTTPKATKAATTAATKATKATTSTTTKTASERKARKR